MHLSERVLTSFTSRDDQTPESVALELGCSRSSAVNYLSRAVVGGLVRKVFLPGMPPEGGWVLSLWRGHGEAHRSDPGAFALWSDGGVEHHVSVYSDFLECRLAAKRCRKSDERFFSAVDVTSDSLVSCAESRFEGKGAGATVALRCLRPGDSLAVLARAAGVSTPTLSSRLSSLHAKGMVKSRFLPAGGHAEPPSWTVGHALAFTDGSQALPMSAFSSTGVSLDLLPLVSAAAGFPTVRESMAFEGVLKERYGEVGAKAASVARCLHLTNPFSRFLPPRELRTASERLCGILEGIAGESSARNTLGAVSRARRSGGFLRIADIVSG